MKSFWAELKEKVASWLSYYTLDSSLQGPSKLVPQSPCLYCDKALDSLQVSLFSEQMTAVGLTSNWPHAQPKIRIFTAGQTLCSSHTTQGQLTCAKVVWAKLPTQHLLSTGLSSAIHDLPQSPGQHLGTSPIILSTESPAEGHLAFPVLLPAFLLFSYFITLSCFHLLLDLISFVLLWYSALIESSFEENGFIRPTSPGHGPSLREVNSETLSSSSRPQSRAERTKCLHAPLFACAHLISLLLNLGNDATHIGLCLSTSINIITTIPNRHTNGLTQCRQPFFEILFPNDSRLSQVDNWNLVSPRCQQAGHLCTDWGYFGQGVCLLWGLVCVPIKWGCLSHEAFVRLWHQVQEIRQDCWHLGSETITCPDCNAKRRLLWL